MHFGCLDYIVYKSMQTRMSWQDEFWAHFLHLFLDVLRFYITLDLCVEEVVHLTGCVEPCIKDQVFLEVHRTFFSLCSYMQSPDLPSLLLLMLPCIVAVLALPITSVYFTTCRASPAASPGL